MKKITNRMSLLFIAIGFLLIIISSCSDIFHAQVEKRKYRDGFYLSAQNANKHVVKKKNQSAFYNTETDGKQNLESSTLMADNTNDISLLVEKKKEISFSEIKKTNTNKPVLINSENDFRKNTKRNHIEKKAQVQSFNDKPTKEDKPCPNNGSALKIIGLVFMIMGLVCLTIPQMAALVFGAILGLLGLILIIVGKSMREPYIKKTEPVAIASSDSIHTPLKLPQFDFKPTKSANPKVVSLALVQPKYAKDFEYSGVSPFTEFAKSMENDFEEILIERDYTFIGPFKDYDEMVYNDKSKTDLLLDIEININWKNESFKSKTIYDTLYTNQIWSCGKVIKVMTGRKARYKFEGYAEIGAELNIKLSEIMTQQKVWVKTPSIDPVQIYVKSEKEYDTDKAPRDIWTKDPGFYNPLVDFLEKYYKVIMQKAYNHLDPNELKLLKPQIEEIREKSGYGRH